MEFNVEDYLSNISYINKDFESVWYEILGTVPKLTNKWIPSEANESDPLVVLLKELAILTDKLNYNTDKNVLELFPATLTQRRSAFNVYESLGYTPDWYKSATLYLTIAYNGMLGDTVPTVNSDHLTTYTFPRFTAFTDDDSEIVYTSLESFVIELGIVSKHSIAAIEGTMHDFEINGSTQILYSNLDSQNRLYFSENNIAQNGVIISNNSDFSDYAYDTEVTTDGSDTITVWTRVDNLNQYNSGNYIYKLGIDNNTNSVYLQFPDDIGNLIGDGLYIKYITSTGESGNVGKASITQLLNSFEADVTLYNDDTEYTLTESNFSVSNTTSSQNGADPLTVSEMLTEFKKTAGVFETLVTLRDYENYIYNYTYPTLDTNVVSNIRVTDRYHDLWNTITYQTLNLDGELSSVTETIPLSDESSMTAYDLRLYPLFPSDSIDDRDDFDTTFNQGTSTLLSVLQEEVEGAIDDSKCISHDFVAPGYPILIPYDLEGQIYLKSQVSNVDATEILSNVELALYKALNSRELEWGRMIDYGDVVDVIEDADSRIQYVGLNAIEYGDPMFTEYSVSGDVTSAYGDTETEYDITVRSILNGNVAWTTYEPYLYEFGQTNFNYYGLDSHVIDTKEGVDITAGVATKLQTVVKIANAGKSGDENFLGETLASDGSNLANIYIVNTNETFTVLIPEFNVLSTYGNYLYYVAVGSGSDTIYANVPTALTSNQYIYIYESRTDAVNGIESMKSNGVSGAAYILSPGTIIKPSVDITFTTKSDLDSSSSYVNMGSSNTIDTLERAAGVLKPSVTITSGSAETLYFKTNSQALHDAFGQGGTSYTLLSGEYFFYTDAHGAELGIISEGTTLTIKDPISDDGGNNYASMLFSDGSDSTIASLAAGKLTSTSYTTDWAHIETDGTTTSSKYNAISYELNDVYTFGENYAIRCLDEDEKLVNFLVNYEENTFFTDKNVQTVQYTLLTKSEVIDNDEGGDYTMSGDWESLDSPLAGSESDGYQFLVRLALTCGPGGEQILMGLTSHRQFNSFVKTEETILDEVGNSRYIVAETYQDLYIKEAGKSGETDAQAETYLRKVYGYVEEETDSSGNNIPVWIYVQSSQAISYEGGPILTLTEDEQEVLQIMTHTVSDTISRGSTEFMDFTSITEGITTLDIPGRGGQYVLFALTFSSSGDFDETSVSIKTGEIYYLIIPAGVTCKVNGSLLYVTVAGLKSGIEYINVSQISRPYVISSNAKYYNSTKKTWESIGNLSFSDDTANAVGGVLLTDTQLYYDGYCPLYTPTSSEKIEDPEDSESYFLTQHVCNKFVLPYLEDINLTINPYSISS